MLDAVVFVSIPDECDRVSEIAEQIGWRVTESGIAAHVGGGEWVRVERIKGSIALSELANLVRAAGLRGRFAEASKFWSSN